MGAYCQAELAELCTLDAGLETWTNQRSSTDEQFASAKINAQNVVGQLSDSSCKVREGASEKAKRRRQRLGQTSVAI